MNNLKKGQKVKYYVTIMGYTEVVEDKIKEVTSKYIKLEGTKGLKFDPKTGQEMDPVFPGATSYFKVVKSTK